MTREEVIARLDAAGLAAGRDGLAPPRRSDFDLLPERGTRFERGTHDVFRCVTTVNICLIEGRDSLIERCSDFGIDMFNRRIGIVCQAPHTVNELAELQPLSNLKTFHKFHLKLCSIVYALISAM